MTTADLDLDWDHGDPAPEAKLAAAVIKQAVADARDLHLSASVRSGARAFLRSGAPLAFVNRCSLQWLVA
jgi:hypothetical protein